MPDKSVAYRTRHMVYKTRTMGDVKCIVQSMSPDETAFVELPPGAASIIDSMAYSLGATMYQVHPKGKTRRVGIRKNYPAGL